MAKNNLIELLVGIKFDPTDKATYEKQLKEIQSKLDQMKKSPAGTYTPGELKEAELQVAALEKALKKYTDQKGRARGVNTLYREEIDKQNASTKNEIISLDRATNAIEKQVAALKKETKEQKELKQATDATTQSIKKQTDQYGGYLDKAGRYHGTTGRFAERPVDSTLPVTTKIKGQPGRPPQNITEEIGKTTRHAALAAPIYGTVYGGMSLIQQSIQDYIEFDKVLNRIGIVSNQSSESLKIFAKQAQETGKQLAVTAKDYADAALIFYQQGGRALDNATSLAKASIEMSNVLGLSQQDSSDALTAIMNSFDILATDGEKAGARIADVIVKLDQTTASSGGEISDGLKRFASTAREAGFTFEEAASMFATVSSATRLSSETIGTAFKTFLTNLQEVKDSGPEEVLKFTNKLNEVAKKYKIKIQPFDASGELRSGKEILDQVAAAYSTLTSNTERQDLVQAIAGKHQINIVQSLLSNWQEYQTQVENAQTSQGAANEAQAQYNTSLIAHVNRLKNAWEGFMHALVSSDELKGIIDFLEKLVNILTKVVEGRGLVNLILEIVGAIVILRLNLSKLQTTLKESKTAGTNSGKAIGDAFTISSEKVKLAAIKMKTSFMTILPALKSIASQLLIMNGIFGAFSALTDKNISGMEKWNKSLFSVAQIGLGLALQASMLPPPIGIPLMITGLSLAGITGIGGLLTMPGAKKAERTREAQTLIDAQLDKQTSKYEENRTSIKENADVLEELSKKINLNEEDFSRLQQARNSLNTSMPGLTEYEDEYGNTIQRTTEQIKEQIDANEQLLRTREATRADDPEYIKQVKKDLEAAQTALDNFLAVPVPTKPEEKQAYEQYLDALRANLKEQERIAIRLEVARAKIVFPNYEDIDKSTKLFSEMGYTSKDVSKAIAASSASETIKNIISRKVAGETLSEEDQIALDNKLNELGYAISTKPGAVDLYNKEGKDYNLQDIQRIDFNSSLVESIKEIIGAQSDLNEKIKEYGQITIDNYTTEKELSDKKKEIEFGIYQTELKKIAASKDTTEEQKKQIDELLAKNTQYSEEGLKQSQELLDALKGNTVEFVATIDSVSQIFYANLANLASRWNQTYLKAQIEEKIKGLGIPDSVIEDAQKKGYSLIEVYVKLYEALEELAKAKADNPLLRSTFTFGDVESARQLVNQLNSQSKDIFYTVKFVGFNVAVIEESLKSDVFAPKGDNTRKFTEKDVFGQPFVDLHDKADAFESYQSKIIDGAEKQNELLKIQKDLSEELNKTQDLETRNKLLDLQKSITSAQGNQLGMTKTQLKYYQDQVKSLKDKVSLEKQSNAENRLMLVRQAGGGFTYQFKRGAPAASAGGASAQTPQQEATDLRAKNAAYLKQTTLDLVGGVKDAVGKIEAVYGETDPNSPKTNTMSALNNFLKNGTTTGNPIVDTILSSISSLVAAAKEAKAKFDITNKGTLSPGEKAASDMYTTAQRSKGLKPLFGLETGGYTGDSQGLAMLHQKELVLNKEDTRNILNAVNIMRAIPFSANSQGFAARSGGTNQNVTINANFPNVSSADEIKRAFASMSNNALQFNARTKVVGAGVK